ncbi:hypothetical protein B0H14DRAFT_3555565 [Mycena olivaceomarginata]|nr:hypothetical protein B0H14DRAFT_3555565 [Mycena olivaceomarginata]
MEDTVVETDLGLDAVTGDSVADVDEDPVGVVSDSEMPPNDTLHPLALLPLLTEEPGGTDAVVGDKIPLMEATPDSEVMELLPLTEGAPGTVVTGVNWRDYWIASFVVFRDPVLGLRNDRTPKFICPFPSCKSAKIMLDPATGVSRGYGFVRFADEADQQRALDARALLPLTAQCGFLRICSATTKFKAPHPDGLPASASTPSYTSVSTPPFPASVSVSAPPGEQQTQQQQQQAPSMSAPISAPTTYSYYGGGAQQQQQPQQQQVPGQRQGDELRNTSMDPYNTTVFVGGLSPLVGEETLWTFFVPFGEIHYVKVPVGKHCGFVQFVRRADAERAIEKMQGFPVGGSELLRYAAENNIIILGYPPHCTHALQGLDVVCFARMKQIWKEEIEAFERRTGRKVGKGDFALVWGTGFKRAFTPETVQAAFRATGVFPFNPDVITAAQMKPAEATSTRAAFPLQQSSPVRAVMAAFHHYQPTAFELDEDTHAVAGRSGSVAGPSGYGTRGSGGDSQPVTPARRARDPNIDPALYTPSKRMRMMTSALGGTASGSFLISKAPITSRSHIAPPVLEGPPILPIPDWNLLRRSPEDIENLSAQALRERVNALTSSLAISQQHLLARDGMIEAANAQLVVLNIFVGMQSEALHAKETKKSKKREKVKVHADGKGRHLTDLEFIDSLAREQAEKAADEAAKADRAQARENRKAAKLELEERWKVMKADHDQAVARWETQCAMLTASGVRKKDLPKKPKRTKKPQLEKVDDSDDNSGGSGSE